ncbi:formylglycine-generating enzyme family protein [Kingella sp. (in: b-proteobacteria)]|uniref:formylglycine-generating enzyme family protein n=1 Tax=Kingella sp. (in: b-proteobacteria) TaxID=2020713 RepID=UPI0026DD76A4|nr:formylglycine-generating enzyme family protein [Kingella sp. (in: b-proteobacteria)]MDO4657993.1 formylglycine-generating enzyme family protein [Kingella sp. (in: b-proteobacteria)]
MRPQHIILLAALFSGCLSAHAVEMASIPSGSYRPLYLKKDTPMISVKAFQIDKTPVTNAEFAQFVKTHPQWQRGKVDAKQAEPNYLKQWDKNGPKAADANKPVTNVSWFAAHAYCAAQGKHLPTNDEWEFVGLASELQANGSNEPSYNRTILSWYENGSKGLKNIRQNKPNFYGVYDMHGLIWEWTSDFNSSQITSGTLKAADFCGTGAVNSSDPSNYAAFLRYGIRTSLQPNFVLHNMGFRCAK